MKKRETPYITDDCNHKSVLWYTKKKREADINAVGTLAAQVMAEAVKRAVLAADPAYGLLSSTELEDE